MEFLIKWLFGTIAFVVVAVVLSAAGFLMYLAFAGFGWWACAIIVPVLFGLMFALSD